MVKSLEVLWGVWCRLASRGAELSWFCRSLRSSDGGVKPGISNSSSWSKRKTIGEGRLEAPISGLKAKPPQEEDLVLSLATFVLLPWACVESSLPRWHQTAAGVRELFSLGEIPQGCSGPCSALGPSVEEQFKALKPHSACRRILLVLLTRKTQELGCICACLSLGLWATPILWPTSNDLANPRW